MNTIRDDNLIFHYCSTQTALSILKNNEIWMTSICNMNDSNESIGVYKIFFDLLKKYDTENSLDAMYEFTENPGAIQLYENPLGAYSEYAVCFSKNPDSVSQWVSYADNGQGMAIGFDKKSIIDIASKNKNYLRYQEISYIDEKSIQKYIPDIYNYLVHELCDNRLEMMDKAMEQIKRFFPLGNAFKTKHYASENETRLIYQYSGDSKDLSDGWKIKECQAFARRNMINTYVPLKFPKDLIKKVVVGPKYQKKYFQMEMALETLGYTNMIIEKSTSGYR